MHFTCWRVVGRISPPPAREVDEFLPDVWEQAYQDLKGADPWRGQFVREGGLKYSVSLWGRATMRLSVAFSPRPRSL